MQLSIGEWFTIYTIHGKGYIAEVCNGKVLSVESLPYYVGDALWVIPKGTLIATLSASSPRSPG